MLPRFLLNNWCNYGSGGYYELKATYMSAPLSRAD